MYNSGVPQGSILGPYLFNFFVSDLLHKFTLPQNLYVKQYADDLQAYIVYDVDSAQQSHSALLSFIQHIVNWSEKNYLTLSYEKTEVIYFGNDNPNYPYLIAGHKIIATNDCIRNLGLLITPSLKWNIHIKAKCKFALKRWYNLARVAKMASIDGLTLIYKQFVRPILEFPSIIVNPITPTLIKDIEIVQH